MTASQPFAALPFAPAEAKQVNDAVKLYGPDNRLLGPDDFKTPWDPGPLDPWATQWGSRTPQSWAYPLSANRFFTPRSEEQIPSYAKLRWLATWCDYVRIAIEYRKDQFAAKSWAFKPRGARNSRQQRAELKGDIVAATEFWQKPDRINDYDWPTWVKQIIEEAFVTDGVRLYKWRDFMGKIYALFQVDPAMMKPVIDTFGIISGWQQIVRGLPRTTYPSGDVVANQYSPRVDSNYGTSHLEDISQTVEVAIRKMALELAVYTEGNVPVGFVQAPEGWTGQQIEAFQNFVNASLGGNDSAKVRLRIIPFGAKYESAKPLTFDEAHEHALISRVTARFCVNRSIFITTPNRGSTETVESSVTDAGHKALMQYVSGIVNKVTWEELGLTDVEWNLTDPATRDIIKEAQARKLYVEMGAVQSEEVRDELGYDALEEEEQTGPTAQELTLPVLQSGSVKLNEVRAALKLEPIPGPAGEAFVTIGSEPVSLAGLTREVKSSEEEPKPQQQPLALAAAGGANGGANGGGKAGSGGVLRPVAPTDGAAGAELPADGGRGANAAGGGEKSVGKSLTFVPADFGGEDDPEPLAAANERLKWERFAVKRAGSVTKERRAHQFKAAQMNPWEALGIRRALRKAADRYEVQLAFRKAKKRLTKSAKGKAIKAIAKHALRYLQHQKARVMDYARGKLEKADAWHDPAASHAFELDFGTIAQTVWLGSAQDVADDLRDSSLDFNYFNENAVAYAKGRAGELITEIDETTRDTVNDLVQQAISDGWSMDDFASRLEDTGAFGESRAEMIARSETRMAQNYALIQTGNKLGVDKFLAYDGTDDELCAARNGEVFTSDEALAEEDEEHPNGTLGWAPMVSEEEDEEEAA